MSQTPLLDDSDYQVFLSNALIFDTSLFAKDFNKDRLPEYCTRFDREIDAIITEHGIEAAGNAVYYILGGVNKYLQVVLHTSRGRKRLPFMESVKTLYLEGFNRHCIPEFDGENLNSLNAACYMLWDMDSIECPAYNDDPEMWQPSLDVLTFALHLDNPACQKSALHGLGHLVHINEQAIQPIIRKYLQTNPPPPQREYAESALEGSVQ